MPRELVLHSSDTLPQLFLFLSDHGKGGHFRDLTARDGAAFAYLFEDTFRNMVDKLSIGLSVLENVRRVKAAVEAS